MNNSFNTLARVVIGACILSVVTCALTSCSTTRHHSGSCPQAYGYKNHTYSKPFINH